MLINQSFIHFSQIFHAGKANESLFEFLCTFDLKSITTEYKVPIFYILGEKDWQTPYVIAKEYFDEIKAPKKRLFLVPEAGHMTMLDQPEAFCKALCELNN